MFTPESPEVKKGDTKQIRAAQYEDERHKLHAAVCMRSADAGAYFREFVENYIALTIPNEPTRFQVVRDLSFPLISNQLVDRISDQAAAVHSAQDRFITIQLTDEKLQLEAEQWIRDVDIQGFVTRNCHNAFFSAPNSVVVVDLPPPGAQRSDWPEPYVYLLPSSALLKAEALEGSNQAGLLRFAWFKTKVAGEYRQALIDDTHISVYQSRGSSNNATDSAQSSAWVLVSSEPHGLKHAPIFKLWADTDLNNPMVSNSMIRFSLSLLDQYCYWNAVKNTNDHKAGLAMLAHWKPEPKACDFTFNGSVCQDGVIYLIGEDGQFADEGGNMATMACPSCSTRKKKGYGGPGMTIPMHMPASKEDFDPRDPAKWIDAPIDSLEYIQKKVDAYESRILGTATGYEGSLPNKQALNEDQISSIIEAARQIGEYLGQYFEVLHKRILDCMLGMRYGEYYVGCTVNYGRRFSALSGDLLIKLMTDAKTIGSIWLLEEIDGMLRDYYARGDTFRAVRYDILRDLTRYNFQSPADMVAAQLNTLDRDGFLFDAGLLSYVKRFEREQGVPVERFAEQKSYSDRVEIVSEAIRKYVKEIAVVEPVTTVPADNGSAKPAKKPAKPVQK